MTEIRKPADLKADAAIAASLEGEGEMGKLTKDDLTMINGRREQLEGKLQERYGWAKDQVRKEIDNWLSSQGNGAPGDPFRGFFSPRW